MKGIATSYEQLSLPYCEYLDTPTPHVLITDVLGKQRDGSGIDCQLMARVIQTLDQLAKERGYECINILINTDGGDVDDSMSIYNAMLKVKIPVDTYVTGKAASMGGVLFQAGRKRYMADYSIIMMHNPSGSSNKKQLKACKDSLVKMLARHGMTDESTINTLMNRESWIPAEECLELGLCDVVEDSSKINNLRNINSTKAWEIFEKTTNTLKKKVA